MGLLLLLTLLPAPALGAEARYDLLQAFDAADSPEALSLAWEGGFVSLPRDVPGPGDDGMFGILGNEAVQTRLSRLEARSDLPVVLLMHGCEGFSVAESQFLSAAHAAGYAVIAPNSFARPLRERDCDPNEFHRGRFPPVQLYRRAELLAAMDRVRELAWVDRTRIVVAGIDEGAIAVALWGGEVEASGYMILGWTCTARGMGWLNGLRLPKDAPTLAIVSRDDPWYGASAFKGECGDQDRDALLSVRIEGSSHNVFYYPFAHKLVTLALRDWGLGR